MENQAVKSNREITHENQFLLQRGSLLANSLNTVNQLLKFGACEYAVTVLKTALDVAKIQKGSNDWKQIVGGIHKRLLASSKRLTFKAERKELLFKKLRSQKRINEEEYKSSMKDVLLDKEEGDFRFHTANSFKRLMKETP